MYCYLMEHKDSKSRSKRTKTEWIEIASGNLNGVKNRYFYVSKKGENNSPV